MKSRYDARGNQIALEDSTQTWTTLACIGSREVTRCAGGQISGRQLWFVGLLAMSLLIACPSNAAEPKSGSPLGHQNPSGRMKLSTWGFHKSRRQGSGRRLSQRFLRQEVKSSSSRSVKHLWSDPRWGSLARKRQFHAPAWQVWLRIRSREPAAKSVRAGKRGEPHGGHNRPMVANAIQESRGTSPRTREAAIHADSHVWLREAPAAHGPQGATRRGAKG